MPSKETFAIDFNFLDPAKLAVAGYVGEGLVRVVTGLVRGTYLDVAELELREQTTVIDHNLIEIVHRVQDRRRLELSSTDVGTVCTYYCSRCGRKFVVVPGKGYKCRLCNISFRLKSTNESVIGAFPPAPPRVFAYLQERGYRFKRRLPRY